MKHEHILVIRFSEIADVAMTVPIVWALAQQYPHTRITILSRPVTRPLFDQLAPNVCFMAADVKREYKGIKGLNKLYRRLVAKQFTSVADLHNVLHSEYLRLRFNLGRYRVEHLIKHRRLLGLPKRHKKPVAVSFNNYLDVFTRLGYPVSTDGLPLDTLEDLIRHGDGEIHSTRTIREKIDQVLTKNQQES